MAAAGVVAALSAFFSRNTTMTDPNLCRHDNSSSSFPDFHFAGPPPCQTGALCLTSFKWNLTPSESDTDTDSKSHYTSNYTSNFEILLKRMQRQQKLKSKHQTCHYPPHVYPASTTEPCHKTQPLLLSHRTYNITWRDPALQTLPNGTRVPYPVLIAWFFDIPNSHEAKSSPGASSNPRSQSQEGKGESRKSNSWQRLKFWKWKWKWKINPKTGARVKWWRWKWKWKSDTKLDSRSSPKWTTLVPPTQDYFTFTPDDIFDTFPTPQAPGLSPGMARAAVSKGSHFHISQPDAPKPPKPKSRNSKFKHKDQNNQPSHSQPKLQLSNSTTTEDQYQPRPTPSNSNSSSNATTITNSTSTNSDSKPKTTYSFPEPPQPCLPDPHTHPWDGAGGDFSLNFAILDGSLEPYLSAAREMGRIENGADTNADTKSQSRRSRSRSGSGSTFWSRVGAGGSTWPSTWVVDTREAGAGTGAENVDGDGATTSLGVLGVDVAPRWLYIVIVVTLLILWIREAWWGHSSRKRRLRRGRYSSGSSSSSSSPSVGFRERERDAQREKYKML
ncbi:hypothetical protein F5Y16DRAFT_399122 [Xylariaceae sp. FL0255]|nr:hypothetical protein F5Y16DRAFT_399122 [Xylariaceae sp. FL0255]